MKPTILFLVRMFQEEQHAIDFLNGRLYLNRLSYFKDLKDSKNDGRPDEREAIAAWLHGASITFQDHPELDIKPEHLAAPVSISFDYYNHVHVFCMTAIHTGEFDCTDGLISYAEADAPKLRQQLEIDRRCQAFGDFAVVVRAGDFVLRAKRAIESQGYGYNSTLVTYFDPRSFNGQFAWRDIPFRKVDEFSYQNEYRIVVDTRTAGEEPLLIDIGEIKDIAARMPTAEVNASFQVG
jgi:hypothetical protein